MNAGLPRDPSPPPPAEDLPESRVRPRGRINLIWLIPLAAGLLAAYLGWRTLSEHGPTITLRFSTAQGLAAGQTRVRHKAVDLGTVEGIRLSPDMGEVLVTVRMTREAEPYLTDRARFWVVRPRIASGSLSGIETLVSGAYIEMDPGNREGGQRRTEFTGLEQPPAVRSDEPGRSYTLLADRLGSLGPGAPVFWRDIVVGEVLGYDLGDGAGPVKLQVFVRAPYDGYVRQATRFWNASGLSVQIGAEGVHVELASLQALLSGGVAFATPPEGRDAPAPGPDETFPLWHSQAEADVAGFRERIPFVTYFSSSVRGLNRGAAVEFYGIQIGTVRDVRLEVTPDDGNARVRVAFEVQPERIMSREEAVRGDRTEITRRLIGRGMRAQLKTASYITGQMVLALDFVPNAAEADLQQDGPDMVIPSQGGGIDNILTTVSDIAAKLDRLPIERIASSIDGTLSAVRDTVASPELRQAIRNLQATLAGTETLVRRADAGLTPVLNRLPAVVQALQDTIVRANRTVAGIDTSYGGNSGFARELERAMAQVGDTARSIRILADFLDRHPEALVRGRAGIGATR